MSPNCHLQLQMSFSINYFWFMEYLPPTYIIPVTQCIILEMVLSAFLNLQKHTEKSPFDFSLTKGRIDFHEGL